MALIHQLKAVATQILGNPEIGRKATLVRVTGVVSDPVAGTVTKTETETEANSYFDAPNHYNTPAGWNVEAQDVLAYLDQEVAIEDRVLRNGITWSVVNVIAYEAGDGIALWVAQLRR